MHFLIMLILTVVVGNAVAAPYPSSGRIYRDFKDDSFFKIPPRQPEIKPEVKAPEPPVERGATISSRASKCMVIPC